MWEREDNTIDYAEYWRENYQDALDEIRNLKYRIKELEKENTNLQKAKVKEENDYSSWQPSKPLTVDEAYYFYK